MNSIAVRFCVAALAVWGGALWAADSSTAVGKTPGTNTVAPFHGMTLRGINVRGLKELTDADYAKIAGWGANSIRLQLDADTDAPQRKALGLVVSESPLKLSEEVFGVIKSNLDMAGRHHLAVVITMQNCPGKRSGNLWEDYKYWDILTTMWIEIAKRFGTHPAVVGYDLLNEPNAARSRGDQDIDVKPNDRFKVPAKWKGTPRDYDALMLKLTKAIREIDSKNTLIVEGAYFGGMAVNFNWLKPTGDPNTIYSFHMYMPHEFCDQGGKEGKPVNVKYPAEKFGKKEMYDSMKIVEEFQKKYAAGIYCGEFGPTRMAEPNGAVQYLEDFLAYAEAHGWHTAYQIYGDAPRSLELSPDMNTKTVVPSGTPRLAVMKKNWALNASPAVVEGPSPSGKWAGIVER